MKRVVLWSVLIGWLIFSSHMAQASCSTNHAIQHSFAGIGNLADTTCASCIPRFWCLSTGSANNSGTNISWWQKYAVGTWWYDGSWAHPGVNGCCGMWGDSSTGGNSRAMMAVVEAYANEGTTSHYGQYEAEVCERQVSGSTDFFFSRAVDWNFSEIPAFRIGNFVQSPPGYSTISLAGWATVPSAQGPAHYWIMLQNGISGTDLTQSNICSPGGTASCPYPIIGYKIRAMFRGCADGTCNDPAPARPTTSIASYWDAGVMNGTINGRVPTFPVSNIQIQNPAGCTPANRYLFIATQLLYADEFVSQYVSRNSIELDRCPSDPAGITPLGEVTSMHCQKSGGSGSIVCTYNNAQCAVDNTIYYGPLSWVSTYSYTASICSLGVSGTASFVLSDEDWFWVMAPIGHYCEGTYGYDSYGLERPKAIGIGICNYSQSTCPNPCTFKVPGTLILR